MAYPPSLLAVVGLPGSGKSSSTHLLVERGYSIVYFGGVVVEEVVARGLEITEANEKLVREDLRRTEGMDVMARRREPQIRSLLGEGRRVALDGLGSWAELQYLRSIFGDRLVTLAVHAPRWLRYQRLAKRPRRPLTHGQAEVRDVTEMITLDRAAPIAGADVHVVNDSDLEALGQGIEEALEARSKAIS